MRMDQLTFHTIGGRTAWSTVAVIQGKPFSARFWYDGNYIESAKQDAAEVALKAITSVTPAQSSVHSAGHGGRS